LDPQLGQCEISAAVLTKLEEADYVLSDSHDLAVRILLPSEPLVWTDEDRATLASIQEAECRKQLRSFYKSFFKLSVDRRSHYFHRLEKSCARFPNLQLLHRRLEPGIDLEVASPIRSRNQLNELRAIILRKFVAWPSEAGPLFRSAILPLFKN